MNLSWPSPQLHPRTIRDNGDKPRRHLRLPFELIQVFVSGAECILNRILCVSSIGQVSRCRSLEQRPITRENVLRFTSFILSGSNVEALPASVVCRGHLHMVLASRSGHQKCTIVSKQSEAIESSIFSSMSRLGC